MGNVCASTRNKECLYVAKEPKLVKQAFSDCVYYTKVDSKKNLKKRKKRLLRKVASIQDELQNLNNSVE